MSLINDMLKDLSQRQRTSHVIQNPIDGLLFSAEKSKFSHAIKIAMVFFTVIIWIVAIFLWHESIKNFFQQYFFAPSNQMQQSASLQKPVPVAVKPLAEDDGTVTKIYQPMSGSTWQAKHYQMAMKAVKQNDYGEAISLLQDILNKYPEYQMARESVVAILLEQRQFIKAQQILKDGIMMDPDYLPFIKLHARMLIMQNKFKEAEAILIKHSPNMEDQADYYALLAAVFEKQGQMNKGGAIYQALLKLDPNNASYWIGLAIAFEQSNKKSAARSAYNEALSKGNLKSNLQSFVLKRLQSLRG